MLRLNLDKIRLRRCAARAVAVNAPPPLAAGPRLADPVHRFFAPTVPRSCERPPWLRTA